MGVAYNNYTHNIAAAVRGVSPGTGIGVSLTTGIMGVRAVTDIRRVAATLRGGNFPTRIR